MNLELSPFSIPNFITAESPQGLRRAMLRNNAKVGGFVRYFDIGQINVRGRQLFIAWFYGEMRTSEDIAEVENEKIDRGNQ